MSDEELTPWPPGGFGEPPGGLKDVFPRAALEGPAREAARERWEQAAAALGIENAVFSSDTWAAKRLREQLTSPTFAATGRTCEEVLDSTGAGMGEVAKESIRQFWRQELERERRDAPGPDDGL